MKRINFFKSLATLILAPSIIENIDLKEAVAPPNTLDVSKPCTKSLIQDLSLLTPQFYRSHHEKYGSEQYSLWVSKLNK